MRDQLLSRVVEAVERLAQRRDADPSALLGGVSLTPSKSPEHGDFATNAALVLAKPLRAAPRELADELVSELGDCGGSLARAEVAGPGFVNLFLTAGRWRDVLSRVLREGEAYGRSEGGKGREVMVEFVSANPTGPLTIGHGRNAVLGDCLAGLLQATGHSVTREYYFNDAGRQMRVLAASLRARYAQLLGRDEPLPEDGYRGEYLVEVARALVDEHGDGWLEADESAFQRRAQEAIFAGIEATLDRLGIRFDVYSNERVLYDTGRVDRCLADLRDAGLVYEKDGAVWLESTRFGLNRDRVLVKSSGEATYLLPDIAYHREKLERVRTTIDVLGPDHVEQFPYVRAAAEALGLDPQAIELVLYQWVNLRRGGEKVKMSTREASFVTVDEILDDVGVDAFRYFMIERRADTHLDFDVDLARERSDRNPVYKIQYAHARLCSIERRAAEQGFEVAGAASIPFELLTAPREEELIRLLERFPDLIRHAAKAREPQEVARYLLDLSSAFHAYVSDGKRHRVIGEDRELSAARLGLVGALRATLANGLRLLGIQAPERM
ncbi:MAG: arginine--tRNA ligase [Proteobacteria bacterium]|nr:arginine--tRNA ligase [Pseudomonadota bacterium]